MLDRFLNMIQKMLHSVSDYSELHRISGVLSSAKARVMKSNNYHFEAKVRVMNSNNLSF